MKIQGLETFKAWLANMPDAAREAIRKAVAKSADEIVDLMKRMAPHDTGALRNSIGWTWGAPPEGAQVFAKSGKAARKAAFTGAADEAGLVATIYAGGGDAFYARMQEWGTKNMRANPFFRPAWRLSQKKARGRINSAASRAAKKAAAGRS